MSNFPDGQIARIDQDTVVYVLPDDPRDLNVPKVVVAQRLGCYLTLLGDELRQNRTLAPPV